jgi:hypothetical protein
MPGSARSPVPRVRTGGGAGWRHGQRRARGGGSAGREGDADGPETAPHSLRGIPQGPVTELEPHAHVATHARLDLERGPCRRARPLWRSVPGTVPETLPAVASIYSADTGVVTVTSDTGLIARCLHSFNPRVRGPTRPARDLPTMPANQREVLARLQPPRRSTRSLCHTGDLPGGRGPPADGVEWPRDCSRSRARFRKSCETRVLGFLCPARTPGPTCGTITGQGPRTVVVW